jgi:nitrite reductase/ring-hydroxylating ferredoxin subunit
MIVEGHTLALFTVGDEVFAIDNRCPHMGFPLDRGSVRDGILTCHWHHARFDLASGGTFDLFADDVIAYPAWIEDGGVWVDLTPKGDLYNRLQGRLRRGWNRISHW